jgi:hypothetical protein
MWVLMKSTVCKTPKCDPRDLNDLVISIGGAGLQVDCSNPIRTMNDTDGSMSISVFEGTWKSLP